MKGNSGVLPRWTSGGVVISILMIMIMMMIRRVDAWTHSSSRQLLCRSTSLYLESSLHTVSSTDSSIDCTSKLWDEELPVGARCVALQLQQLQETNQKNWIPPGLHPLELEYGLQLTSFKTRNSFFLGRLALRQVLDTTEPILKDAYGRPRLPAGYVASISHKGNVGVVALLQPPMLGSIGVDLEYSQGNPNVARKVLTPREQECLGRISVGTNQEDDLFLAMRRVNVCLTHARSTRHQTCYRQSHQKKKYCYVSV
ncbi:hypothetical protein FisN_9Lh064 [Fistulifera solaris]|uniref:4'-phosphopantetheinyl transferase N-terminal domain-containing protein n=1 Tax=Fistulifera solaris TaxID=1519565 RepID=A0A1Z5KLI5_FISSO|nr:hypothetical protein FisN_9Lh064 [Fistulifera solaris]|eukprot:GAX26798.1 hypothetical protein FisN_9Lh064 [Fistulifera solaris]